MTDTLTARYIELSMTQIIPDIALYAIEWMKLAADAEAQGRFSLAGMCRSRGDFYAHQDYGEYIRLIEGSFSELLRVDELATVESE